MNKREKILAVAVGLVVIVLGGKFLFTKVFLAPLDDVERDIAAVQKKIDETKRKLQAKNRLIREWKSLCDRSLGHDPEKADLLLNERVTELIAASGLDKVTRTPASPVSRKGSGISFVAVNLTGRGSLAQIVSFLELLYREPYAVKVTALSLSPEDRGDRIKIANCRIEAIVPTRPALGSMPSSTSRPAIPTVRRGSPDPQYAMIATRNLFKPFTPPPPPVVQASRTPDPPRPTGHTPPVLPRDPNGRPGDVIGTVAIGAQAGAYIRNRTEPKLYNLKDTLENQMTLEFVHPLGIVLKDAQGKIVYVEVGGNIDHPEQLTPESLPELYQAFHDRNGQ